MPLPNLPVPTFPNVPPLPGVPPLLRAAGATENIVSTFYAQSTYLGTQTPEVWGVFDAQTGAAALTPDSFASIEYKRPFKISDYPQEQGAFQSYNKVEVPFDAGLRLTCGGSLEARTTFLSALESMVASVTLFTVITPEATYTPVTLERFTYKREAKNGAHLIIAECFFVQIRATAVANYAASNPQTPMNPTAVKNPPATASASQGQIQAVPLSTPPQPWSTLPVQ